MVVDSQTGYMVVPDSVVAAVVYRTVEDIVVGVVYRMVVDIGAGYRAVRVEVD
jgi:hypothetical protein